MPGPNWSRLKKLGKNALEKTKKFTSFEEWRAAEGAANDKALQILKQQEADEAFRLMQEAQQAALERQVAQGQYQQRADMIRDAADEIRFGKTGKQHLITRKSSKPSVTGTQTTIQPKIIKMPKSKVLSDSDMELLRYKIDLYDGARGDKDIIEMFKAMDENPNMFIPSSPQSEIELPYRTGWTLVNNKLKQLSYQGKPITFGEDIFEYGPNSGFRKVQPLFESARDFYHLSDGIKSRPEVKVPSIKSNGLTINRGSTGLTYSQTTNDMLGQYLAGIKRMIDGVPLYQREIPSLYSTKELETAATTVKSPYVTPTTTVKYPYFTPKVTLMENPEYLAKQAALKDMTDAGIQYDARLEHPEWYISDDGFSKDWGIHSNIGKLGTYAYPQVHYSTQGFTTRGHMFGDELESGLGDLRIIVGPSIDPKKPKVSNDWYPTKPGSREDEIVRFIGINPNKTGMWKRGGILSAKSGIHIKKKNRGKFTSWCGGKVTSECIARGKRSSNPAIRKRATFAANARKWKHQLGGILRGQEGLSLDNWRDNYNKALDITQKYNYSDKPLTLQEYLFSDQSHYGDGRLFDPRHENYKAFQFLKNKGYFEGIPNENQYSDIPSIWDMYKYKDLIISKMSDQDAIDLLRVMASDINNENDYNQYINQYFTDYLSHYDDMNISDITYRNEYDKLYGERASDNYINYNNWLRNTHPENYYNYWYGALDDEYDENNNLKPKPTFQVKTNRYGGIIMPNWAFKMLNKDAR